MPRKTNSAASAIPPSRLALFKSLHKKFVELIELKPWELVHESVLLGVRHPVTGALYYAYFMGELGEVVGLNLYDAANVAHWRYTLQRLQEDEYSFSPSAMLSHTFLQLTLSRKTGLQKEVIALHDAAEITAPRGKAGFLEPVYYEAGYAPVLPPDERLQLALDLIPGFIYTLKSIERGIHGSPEELAENGRGLVAFKNEHNRWDLIAQELPLPQAPRILASEVPDATLWKPLQSLPRTDDVYAFHGALLPAPFISKNGRGVYPIMMLCVSLQRRTILQFGQVPAPEWPAEASSNLAAMIGDIGRLPKRFVVTDAALLPLLASLGSAVSIPVTIDEAEGEAAIEAFDFIAEKMGLF